MAKRGKRTRRTANTRVHAATTSSALATSLLERPGFDIPGTAIALLFWVESPRDFVRLLGLTVALILLSHWIWFTRPWHPIHKTMGIEILLVGFLMLVRPLIFPDPTYLYLMTSKGLAENNAIFTHDMVPRRVFVVATHGSHPLHNVTVTVEDKRALQKAGQLYNDYIQTFTEIDTGALPARAQPVHFWLQPATPWDEDYDIAIASREVQISENLRVSCWCKDAFYAMRVTVSGTTNTLFSCRDPDFKGDLSDWHFKPIQPCSDFMKDEPSFLGQLSPRPFVVIFPQSLIDMTPNRITEGKDKALVGYVPSCPSTIGLNCP